MSHVTEILSAIEQGDSGRSEQLLPLVYDELRRLATAKLAQEKPGQTLQATALVHEAYLRLVDQTTPQAWNGRGHFFAAAAEAMRRILVESARRKGRPKHGGDQRRMDLNEALAVSEAPSHDLLVLDEALLRLREQDETLADLVNLKYFAGLTIDEIAQILDVSPRKVDRLWAYARSWLHQEIQTP